MFKLDNDFLTNLGLGSLPVDEKNKLLQAIYERLEMNVGMRLAEKMTDAQLDEFEGFIDRNDEPGALRWLETNFPNYKQVVADELEKLKREISQSAPQILAAAQQNAQAGSFAGAQPAQPAPVAPQAPDPFTAPAQNQPFTDSVPIQPQPLSTAPQPDFAQPPAQPQPFAPQPQSFDPATSTPAAQPAPELQPLQPYQQPQPIQDLPAQQPPAGPQQQ